MKKINYAFWGSDEFSIGVIEELYKINIIPSVIITVPPQPKGRKAVLTPTSLSLWADEKGIKVLSPKAFDDEFLSVYSNLQLDIAVVASYGKIIPNEILEIPRMKTLNIHPSLLPLWRGSSPIQNTILHSNIAGVSIMLLDEKMDHGPILGNATIPLPDSNEEVPTYIELRDRLALEGGKLLAVLLPKWLDGTVTATDQDHSKATFTKILTKKDGLIDLSDDPVKNLRIIRAMNPWPGAYFIHKRKNAEIRVSVKSAHIENGELILERIVPEGKKEMDFESFKRGYLN